MEYMDLQFIILLDVMIAAVLTGIVGFEREWAGKPAGFRTHMIVGGAAALLIGLGEILVASYDTQDLQQNLRTDPLRIVEAIVVGISFIGAGTILKAKDSNNILYLTTAASILFSAGIGISVGLHQYILAVGATLALITINFLLNYLEEWLRRKKKFPVNDEE